MSTPPDIFVRIYRRHGHRCPMSTLGGRLGLAARRLAGGGELAAVYCIRTCAVDGIAETTGCSEAAGCLRVVEGGEHRLLVTGATVRLEISLRPQALTIAGRYRQASETLERERPGLDRAGLEARETALEQILDEVLGELWSLPEEVLLLVRPVSTAEREG